MTTATETKNAIQAPQPNKALTTLGQMLEARRDSLAKLVPKRLSVDRLMKVTLNCVSKNPTLQQCSVTSVLQSVFTAAELGLEPGGALGLAHLVPYGQTCQLIIGYKGLLRLVNNTGEISTIEAVPVHQKDRFYYCKGTSPRIDHEPFLDGDPGPLVRVYSVAVFRHGAVQFDVMSRANIDAIRARSRSGNNGPWVTDYEEMAKKTVAKRLCKYLPLTDEAASGVSRDDEEFEVPEAENNDVLETVAAEVAEKRTRRRLGIVDVPEPTTVDAEAVAP